MWIKKQNKLNNLFIVKIEQYLLNYVYHRGSKNKTSSEVANFIQGSEHCTGPPVLMLFITACNNLAEVFTVIFICSDRTCCMGSVVLVLVATVAEWYYVISLAAWTRFCFCPYWAFCKTFHGPCVSFGGLSWSNESTKRISSTSIVNFENDTIITLY